MKVLVTGAGGFVGQVLVRSLLTHGVAGRAVSRVIAADLAFPEGLRDGARMQLCRGSLADPAFCAGLAAQPLDAVFHLASVPGGAAERDYALGRAVNLDASLALLEALQAQPAPVAFVYASSIAVFGEHLPARVDEQTPAAPALTYGAHKLACELLVADASRRGWVRGCSLRLPGVVARPGDGAGLMSAFMSQIFWKLQAGEPLVVPVRADGTAWWISAECCAANLVHAAQLHPAAMPPGRVFLMPALHASVGDVVGAICDRVGPQRRALVRYEPQDLVQRLFASYPPLSTPAADAAGFRSDGNLACLVQRCLAGGGTAGDFMPP